MTQRQVLVTRDDFQMWVAHMDDALAEFLEQLPQNVREQLDYSRRSLEVLETWLLEQYAAPQALMRDSDSKMLDGAARYVGETFRRTLGVHWTIDLENRNNAYFGLPVLTSTHSPVSPFSLTTAATHRRTGTYLRTVLDNVASAHCSS